MRKLTLALALLAMLILLVACGSKPVAELSAAQQAVQAAKSAEADVYTEEQFRRSEDMLKDAEAQIAAQDNRFAFVRNYNKAKELLNGAKTEADAALQATVTNKEDTRKQAEVALTEAQQAVRTATDALAKAPKGKGTRADIDALQADLKAAEKSLAEAQSALQSGKYKDALNQFRQIKGKAETVNSQIHQAHEKKA